MKVISLLFILAFGTSILSAQKKPLDFSVAGSWPAINVQGISNDGKYVAYTVGAETTGVKLVIQAADHSWKKEVPDVSDATLAGGSQKIVFLKGRDSLGILELGKDDSAEYIDQVESFKVPGAGRSSWLACRLSNNTKDLVLINLSTGEREKFSDVEDYNFSEEGNVLLVQTKDGLINAPRWGMLYVNLRKRIIDTIGHGYVGMDYIFDSSGQLAYISEKRTQDDVVRELRYYQSDMDSAKILADSGTKGMEGMTMSDVRNNWFTDDRQEIVFGIEKRAVGDTMKTAIPRTQVDIYHYRDEALEYEAKRGPFLAVVHLHGGRKVLRLQQREDEFQTGWSNFSGYHNQYVLFRSNYFGSQLEYKWRMTARPNINLVSVIDGTRRLLKSRLNGEAGISRGGKYVIWYDAQQRQWYTYNMSKQTTRNITGGIATALNYENEHPDHPGAAEGIAGWLEDDAAVLIYDRFDIWQVDPNGIKAPINITHGFGARNNTRLRLITNEDVRMPAIRSTDTLLLSAFNLVTKANGFFQLPMDKRGKLKQLTMEPRIYYFTYPNGSPGLSGGFRQFFPPVKAKDAGMYIVRRMSETEYPNLYCTNDFQDFNQLTNLAPQKDYNWYGTELVHWKLFDGGQEEGILYKPENFDPKKKYPVIFYYYERNADALHLFINPDLSNGCMNIPWFVSNGYLVFVPDIHYRLGYPGESAYNSVVSAAMYLSRMPWVDAHKMGLQGHSFGGWETDYLVTRTWIFAAAASGAGSSNLISAYNQLEGRRRMQWFYEIGQGRIGATLWESPELYIKNSPIFKADKVTTPLLIMHNKEDHVVLFSQEAEWYCALDRLGKKVWMLQYDGEGHTLSEERNQLDFSIRLGQFFDYYLKDAQPPLWMTSGVPYWMKGIDDGLGLELDSKKP